MTKLETVGNSRKQSGNSRETVGNSRETVGTDKVQKKVDPEKSRKKK